MTEILKNKLQTLIKEYKLYYEHFDKEKSAVDAKKQEIVEAIKKGSEFSEVEEELEFYLFGLQTKITDLSIISTEIINLYSFSKLLGEELDLLEEEKEMLENMLKNKKKLTFIAQNDGLEERIKGVQEKYIENVRNSPHYAKIKKDLLSSLN